MKSRTKTKADQARIERLIELGCIVCLRELDMYSVPEVHHICGKTKPFCHQMTIPLCYDHHRAGTSDSIISIHPWRTRFIVAYGTESELWTDTNKRINMDPGASLKNGQTLPPME